MINTDKKERHSLDLTVMMRAISPVSHFGDERAGNVSLLRRMALLWNGDRVEVPVISANSFRGRLRRCAARRLLELAGIERLGPQGYYLLFSGGSLVKGADSKGHQVSEIGKLRSMIPMVGLFGGSLSTEILPGSLKFGGMVWPICRETSGVTGIESDRTVFEMGQFVFYTRREDIPASERDLDSEESSGMIYESEAFLPGTEFVVRILTSRATDLEVGCLGLAFEDWRESASLGGNEAKGHGQLDVKAVEIPFVEEYKAYCRDHGEEIRNLLENLP